MLAWSSPCTGDFNQAVKPIDRDQFQCCEKVLNHTQNRPLCHATSTSEICTRCGYNNHSHSYSAVQLTEPTCTESGYALYECACGDSYEEFSEARGHNYATATSAICTRCGYDRSGEISLLSSEDGTRSTVTEVYGYTYNGSQLTQMTVGSNTLTFAYDAAGTPLAVTYNGTAYYYITNLQGDVTGIANSSGTRVVAYTYDAWGNILTTTGSMASTLGAHNPLRYRGYVYDTETGLYYLQSRYYDPEMGRFINADAFAATGLGLLSYNMFTYCLNNPVMYVDSLGAKPFLFIWDYYFIHKRIQALIVHEFGYAMEVYVVWDSGYGFLDLYDAENNEYYEVKTREQIIVSAHTEQMENYDNSNVGSWMFVGYDIPDSPERGTNQSIEGTFEYGFHRVKYEYREPGIIWYTVETDINKVSAAVASIGVMALFGAASRLMSTGGGYITKPAFSLR